MKQRIVLTILFFLIGGCTYSRQQGVKFDEHPVRSFCLETACTNLENSGEHYQRSKRGCLDEPVAN